MQPKPPTGRGPLAGPSYQPPSAPPFGGKPSGSLPASAGTGRAGGNLPHGAEQRLQSSNQYLRTPVVRYSSRMRVGRLHPLRVTLTGLNDAETVKPDTQSGGFDPPIVVQLSVPGALVTPPHVIMPISGGEAHFTVQPMISGKLTGARIEFLAQGRKVSELALPMKANRGYLAKSLLVLALLLPFLIHWFPDLAYVSRINPARSITTSRTSFPGQPRGTAPAKNPAQPAKKIESKVAATEPAKSENKTAPAPEKKTETPEKKTPPTTSLFDVSPPLVMVTLLVPVQEKEASKQPPVSKEETKESAKQSAPPTKQPAPTSPAPAPMKGRGPMLVGSSSPGGIGPRLQGGGDGPGSGASGENSYIEKTDGTRYTGEDAIWAWVRGLLDREGYATKLTTSATYATSVGSLLSFDRKYEISRESSLDWSTNRLVACTMYYVEPVLRFLYRIFIVLPLALPFGELILSLILLALAGLIWMYTNPNRRKLKGPMMDIRLAHA